MDDAKKRYQIKGRRITPWNRSRQLSAIRDLDGALQEIARENGKKGGRPKRMATVQGAEGTQRETKNGGISTKL